MKKIVTLLAALTLTACGGEAPAPEISRRDMPESPQGMGYEQFRNHSMNAGSEMGAIQKRFILLDRDNNGVLTEDEFGGL